MKYNHVVIPTTATFDGEIPLPNLKVTVSDHQNNPFGIQWQRYWDGAPYPDLVKTVPHVAFEVDDLAEAIRDQKVIVAPNSPSTGVLVAMIEVNGAPVEPDHGPCRKNYRTRDTTWISAFGPAEIVVPVESGINLMGTNIFCVQD